MIKKSNILYYGANAILDSLLGRIGIWWYPRYKINSVKDFILHSGLYKLLIYSNKRQFITISFNTRWLIYIHIDPFFFSINNTYTPKALVSRYTYSICKCT